MSFTVFTGPDPSENLSELFKRTPLKIGPICAIVPDSVSVEAMQRKIAGLFGGACLGQRVSTLESFAETLLSKSPSGRKIISVSSKRALVKEILKTHIGESSKYFGIHGYKGFETLFLAFVQDVRSRMDMDSKYAPELMSAVHSYDTSLKKLGYSDHEGIVAGALDILNSGAPVPDFPGTLIIDGFYDFTETQYGFIEKLIKKFNNTAATLVFDQSRTGLFAVPGKLLEKYKASGAKINTAPGIPKTPLSKTLSHFMGTEDVHESAGDTIQVHYFTGQSSESAWIAGTIHTLISEGGLSPEDIMIVSRRMESFGSPLERALRKAGLPIENGVPRPLLSHSLARLILKAVEASIRPERSDLFEYVQRSVYTGTGSDERLIGIPDDKGWSCIIPETDSPEGFVSSVKKMMEWLKITENTSKYILSGPDSQEGVVLDTLLEQLDEFAKLYSTLKRMMKNTEFITLLNDFLESVSFPDNPSVSGILLTDLNHARYAKRGTVFVTGLEEDNFPARDSLFSLQSPERFEEFRKHHRLEEPLLFYLSIAGAAQIYLTYPGVDDENKDNTISPFLREIFKKTGAASSFHPKVPGNCWENGAFSERGVGESLLRLIRTFSGGFGPALSTLENLSDKKASAVKSAVEWQKNSGVPKSADLSESPDYLEMAERKKDRAFSVSELETYLACPLRYFYGKIIGISSDEKEIGEPDASLVGKFIHSILDSFYRERNEISGKAAFTSAEIPAMKALMRKVTDRQLTVFLPELRAYHQTFLMAWKKYIVLWLEAFVDKEAINFSEKAYSPAFTETGFGGSPERGGNSYPALSIEGNGISANISGRIDRVDVLEESGKKLFRVLDYKTKRKEAIDDNHLQLYLYAKAAGEMILPGSVPCDGCIYFLRGLDLVSVLGKKEENNPEMLKELVGEAVLKACGAVGGIREGKFPVNSDKCVTYCDYIYLCRGGVKTGQSERETD